MGKASNNSTFLQLPKKEISSTFSVLAIILNRDQAIYNVENLRQVFNRCQNFIRIIKNKCHGVPTNCLPKKCIATQEQLDNIRHLYLRVYPECDTSTSVNTKKLKTLVNSLKMLQDIRNATKKEEGMSKMVFDLVILLLKAMKPCVEVNISANVQNVSTKNGQVKPFQKYLTRVPIKQSNTVISIDDNGQGSSDMCVNSLIDSSEYKSCLLTVDGQKASLSDFAHDLVIDFGKRPFSLLDFHTKHDEKLYNIWELLDRENNPITLTFRQFCKAIVIGVPSYIMTSQRLIDLVHTSRTRANNCSALIYVYQEQLRDTIQQVKHTKKYSIDISTTVLWNDDILRSFRDLFEANRIFSSNSVFFSNTEVSNGAILLLMSYFSYQLI